VDAIAWVPVLLVVLLYHAIAPLTTQPPSPRVRAVLGAVVIALIGRYLWWRLTATMLVDAPYASVERAWQWLFFGAEVCLGVEAATYFLLMSRRLDRHAEADDNERWLANAPESALPSVDVLIATYNEEWDVLERTIVGACALDYPHVSIHVCDDGRREWLAAKCAEYGVRYVVRPDRAHAKAGNINHALRVTTGDLVLVLDADFVPQRNFLRRTVGFFRSPDVGLVQVPHHFFNGDPLQANVGAHQRVADDQEFFFTEIMPARDAWGVAFSCGSNSLARRSALEAIGGIPTDSITEDILTSVVLLQHGWRTLFLNERLARGLAPEGLLALYTQRARWARGGIQLLFLRNGPLAARGLRWHERLFFLPLSWAIAYPGLLLMVTGPILFLWFDLVAMPVAEGRDLIVYQLPMFLAALGASRRLVSARRSPVLALAAQLFTAFRLAPVVVHSLVRPFAVGFRVTPKGRLAESLNVDTLGALACGLLLVATVSGILVNHLPDFERVPPDAFLAPSVLWGTLGIVVLLTAFFMAFEFPRRREEERFAIGETASLEYDGVLTSVVVRDASVTGAAVDTGFRRPALEDHVILVLDDVGALPARVVRHIDATAVGVVFIDVDLLARRFLLAKLYAHAYENQQRATAGSPPGAWDILFHRITGLAPKPLDVLAGTAATRPTWAGPALRPPVGTAPERLYPRLVVTGRIRAA
jgi:cellulose synthase (UDP-forming)